MYSCSWALNVIERSHRIQSRTDKIHNTERQNTSFLKEKLEHKDLHKSVLNKIMIKYE